jgi:hypothetical protein
VPTATPSKPPRVIPISPKDGLYLEDFSDIGSGGRFAKLFTDVWRRFPHGDRQNLQDGWQRSCPERRQFERQHSESHVPLIQLIPRWKDFGGFPGSTMGANRTFQFGSVTPPGYLLRFFAPLCDLMPPAIATTAIAHELYQASMCLAEMSDDEDEYENDEGMEYSDELFDALAKGAGFGSIQSVNRWVEGVGLNTAGEYGLRNKTTKG